KIYTVFIRNYVVEHTFLRGKNLKKLARAEKDMPTLCAHLDATFAKSPCLTGNQCLACDYLLMPMLFNASRFPSASETIASYPYLTQRMRALEEDTHFISVMPDLPSQDG
ncbi:MAG: glutathione S-transferase domain-containing protein, partial [Pseudomonadota bacterium]